MSKMWENGNFVMISPNQLTKEAGFEDGEWVLFTWKSGHVEVDQWYPGYAHLADKLLSARPLTGPMAIWNFAPPLAQYCVIEEWGVNWFSGPVFGPTTLSKRPFWAKETK